MVVPVLHPLVQGQTGLHQVVQQEELEEAELLQVPSWTCDPLHIPVKIAPATRELCTLYCIVFYVKLLQLEYVPSELQGVTSPLSYGLLYCTVDMVST